MRHYLVTIEMSVWAENAEEADTFVDFLVGDQALDSVTIEPHPGFENEEEIEDYGYNDEYDYSFGGREPQADDLLRD